MTSQHHEVSVFDAWLIVSQMERDAGSGFSLRNSAETPLFRRYNAMVADQRNRAGQATADEQHAQEVLEILDVIRRNTLPTKGSSSSRLSSESNCSRRTSAFSPPTTCAAHSQDRPCFRYRQMRERRRPRTSDPIAATARSASGSAGRRSRPQRRTARRSGDRPC